MTLALKADAQRPALARRINLAVVVFLVFYLVIGFLQPAYLEPAGIMNFLRRGVSKSQVSRLCEEIDARVKAFLDRPLESDWPYVWLDATHVKVRRNHRIVSVAVIVAVGVKADGRREVLGMDIGPSEAETLWTELPHANCAGTGCGASSSSSPTPTRASRLRSPS